MITNKKMNNSKQKLLEAFSKIDKSFKINESVSDNNGFHFVEQVTKIRSSGYDSYNSEYDSVVEIGGINLYWSLKLITSETGVDKMVISIDKLEGQYNIKSYDQQSDELVQETTNNISDIEWKFIVGNDTVLKLNGSLYVDQINLWFDKNECEVFFL